MLYRLQRILDWLLFSIIWIIMLNAGGTVVTDQTDRVRAYTRSLEFDYLSWTFNAARVKIEQNALGMPAYLSHESRMQVVTEYLRLTEQAIQVENQLNLVYTDPAVHDPVAASAGLLAEMDDVYAQQGRLAPLVESVLQDQVSSVLADMHLAAGGQPLPPVLYHVSPLPLALIVSPRGAIQEDANISLLSDLPLDQQAALEDRVNQALDVSSLVVPVGGIGTYPTMVMRTTSLPWLLETVAHEWTHNYLSLRPLGINYDTTPQLRTMNETTAAIAGSEIGKLVLQRFYPQLAGSLQSPLQLVSLKRGPIGPGTFPPPFDFRSEMHRTRVTVDELLSQGKISEAETYMEARRQVFWAHGFPIRKLNQAYFAFYGAYADIPGGPAGEDPVGPAVRLLREQSRSLAAFINRISWMTSFGALQRAVEAP